LTGRGGTERDAASADAVGRNRVPIGRRAAFATVAAHDEKYTAPAGDVINAFLPADRPCLILVDELMNYVSQSRRAESRGGRPTLRLHP